jgi:phage terminase large subunit
MLQHRHTEYILKGGRGSAKSSFFAIEGVELLLNNPTMHWLILRQVSNTLRDSVFNQVIWALDTLGIISEFTYTKNPLEITYNKTGQKIYLEAQMTRLKSNQLSRRLATLVFYGLRS